ncbi:MAG: SIMPL domain-containing protein [Ignavibacteria bacterium]|jgi:uncharacterized protein YggE
MKQNTKILFTIIFLIPFLLYAQERDKRQITVSGNAEVKVTPDEVILTLGVETQNKEINKAKAANDSIIKKIIAVALEQNIEKKFIQTDYLEIEPRYKDYREIEDFIGYFVRKTIVLTIRDLSKFEDILSQVLEAGATHVHGIKFRTTELRKYRDQARSLAVKAAKEKAIVLAAELGQDVGDPYNIQENSSGWWSNYNRRWGSRWSGGLSQNVIQNVDSPDSFESDGSMALGQIKISATVTVSFELK